ncbi:MAG: 3-hydroxy-3-methylglutaryl-coenzyme A reductase [Methanonatronarchaeales archaeon]|nr:3-hydroxy-3-methylglutaryl-coenzyme A reductase [Methanonatronarchaeales archaeon]
MNLEEAVSALASGDMKLRDAAKALDEDRAVEARRRALEARHDLDLSPLDGRLRGSEAENNVENMVGALEIPLGVAPELEVHGEHARGIFDVPLATTEGALVASVSRGCSAVRESGGAVARILKDGMTRAPVFLTSGVEEALKVSRWIDGNPDAVNRAVSSTTEHGELLDVEPFPVGRNLFLRLRLDAKDAMGMNMVTIASEAVAELIEGELGIRLVSLSGNMCVDKKPSALNVVRGRGKSVAAEVVVPRDTVERVLKCTPDSIVDLNVRKNLIGSARAASLGFNAHHANIVAALFLATGQDEAHVVEGSTGITTAEAVDGDLYLSVTLPALPIGTVGGGTRLPAQRACLETLGVAGGGEPPGENADRLAEIAAATVLAGELSLMGALAAGHLSRAHEELGR